MSGTGSRDQIYISHVAQSYRLLNISNIAAALELAFT